MVDKRGNAPHVSQLPRLVRLGLGKFAQRPDAAKFTLLQRSLTDLAQAHVLVAECVKMRKFFTH